MLRNESFASFSYDTITPQYYALDHSLLPQDLNDVPPIKLCIDRLADVKVENNTYVFDVSQRKSTFKIDILTSKCCFFSLSRAAIHV